MKKYIIKLRKVKFHPTDQCSNFDLSSINILALFITPGHFALLVNTSAIAWRKTSFPKTLHPFVPWYAGRMLYGDKIYQALLTSFNCLYLQCCMLLLYLLVVFDCYSVVLADLPGTNVEFVFQALPMARASQSIWIEGVEASLTTSQPPR